MSVKKYKVLIFDADHTLIDYTEDERVALRTLLTELGIEPTDETLKECNRISEKTWTAAGLYDVHSERIQREYHRLYRAHTEELFSRVFEKYPCSANPKKAGERFLELLCEPSKPSEEVFRTLKALGKAYRICIATNGVCDIQRGRTAPLRGLFERLFISEEMGFIKPLPAFFAYILCEMQVQKEDCLMIGDSLFSDIAGAKAAGIDSCWLNGKGVKNTTEFVPTHEIGKIEELIDLLRIAERR